MKKRSYILICCVSYIAIAIAIYYAVGKYIDKKVIRLHNEAIANLNSFFESKPKYVDLLYGPYKCNYKEVQIPEPNEPKLNDVLHYIKTINPTLTFDEAENKIRQNLKNAWKKEYENYRKMYELDIFPTENENIHRSGWALKVICKRPKWTQKEGIETYFIFPKQIAYKEITPLLYGSVPSIETAIQEALYFTTKNEKSDLQSYYEKGSTYNLITKMESAINNEYYHLKEDPSGEIIYYNASEYGHKLPSIECGGIQNGYYEVIYHRTQPISYSIQFVGDIQFDKNRLTAIYVGLLTLIALIIIIFIAKKR